MTISTSLVCALDGALDVPAGRWVRDAAAADLSVLQRVRGPALDVGCGPGRHVVALAERGICALGIDVTPRAVEHARSKGAAVLERSVFARVPGAGRWASALLLDGNIGIGGDPAMLLARVASLVRADGCVLVEVDRPGIERVTRTVRLDIGAAPGPWFELVRIGVDTLDAVVETLPLRVTERWSVDGRWFASLEKAH